MEIPQCPIAEHAGSVVVRAGRYGKPPHRRRRWPRRPPNGDPRHRFTPVLTRQGEPHAHCLEGSTGLQPWEGRAGARDYRFCARELGEALAALAAGASYRQAAEAARRRAHRVPSGATREPGAGRREPLKRRPDRRRLEDVFSDYPCASELPGRWPQTPLIDSKDLRIRTGEHAGRGPCVLAAMGSEGAGARQVGTGAEDPAPGAIRAQGPGRPGGVLRLA